MQTECNWQAQVRDYYDQTGITDDIGDTFVVQRALGFPSLTGNGKWICMHECYVC